MYQIAFSKQKKKQKKKKQRGAVNLLPVLASDLF